MTFHRATRLFFAGLVAAVALTAGAAHAAEILADADSLRVVTGDWAAWVTRGIEGRPVPVVVAEESLRGVGGRVQGEGGGAVCASTGQRAGSVRLGAVRV